MRWLVTMKPDRNLDTKAFGSILTAAERLTVRSYADCLFIQCRLADKITRWPKYTYNIVMRLQQWYASRC